MIALVIILGLVLVLAAQVIWALLRREPEARRVIGTTIAIAVAGYLLTGHPLQPNHPAARIPADTNAVEAFAEARHQWLTGAGDVSAWLTLAEALEGGGNTLAAVEALNAALARNPNSPDLWIGLGNALVLHADSALTPAARLAYSNGERLGARRPELRNFRLLACKRTGQACWTDRHSAPRRSPGGVTPT